MEIIRKYKALLVTALIVVIAIFAFFYHFGNNDNKVLMNFSKSYKNFDKAILNYSTAVLASNSESEPAADVLEHNADEALVNLNTVASARISSLTKHDAELMSTTLEIADLSGKELAALKIYKSATASKNANLDTLAKEIGDLTKQRKSAYAHFQELSGLID